MEKRLLVFLVLTLGIMILWYRFFAPPPPARPGTGPNAPAGGTGALAGGTGAPAEGTGAAAGGPAPAKPGPVAPPVEAGPGNGLPESIAPAQADLLDVDTARTHWLLSSRGGTVARAQLKDYTEEPEQVPGPDTWYRAVSEYASDGKARRDLPPELLDGQPPAGLFALSLDVIGRGGKPAIWASRMEWTLTVDEADRKVYELDLSDAAGVVLWKEFRFPESAEGLEGAPYHLDLAVGMNVTDPQKAARYGTKSWHFRLVSVGGLPLEGAFRARVWGSVLTKGMVSPDEKSADDETRFFPPSDQQGPDRYVRWVGSYSRFFTAILAAKDVDRLAAREAVLLPVVDHGEKDRKFDNVAPSIDFRIPLAEAGKNGVRKFLFYVGPMDRHVLGEGPYETFDGIINYGWFGFIAKPMVFLLGLFRAVVVNWGVAILLLTLMVRLAMFPLSRKSQIAMQRYQRDMARLKPKLDAIKERHKANKKKQQEETMKLFREENVRMLPAGCLVMFLQMPIFIGLYQALRYSIGLRHSAFLWAKDLTAPDHLLRIGDVGFFLIPEWLNVFPIVMGVTWYLSSAMAPKPADPQQQQTMKMMKWMPVLFSVMLYSYPAGLALYMVVSSSWSIFETKVVKKFILKDQPVAAVGPAPTFRKGR